MTKLYDEINKKVNYWREEIYKQFPQVKEKGTFFYRTRPFFKVWFYQIRYRNLIFTLRINSITGEIIT